VSIRFLVRFEIETVTWPLGFLPNWKPRKVTLFGRLPAASRRLGHEVGS